MNKRSERTNLLNYYHILFVANINRDNTALLEKTNHISRLFKGRLSILSIVELEELIEQGLEIILDNRIERAKNYLQNIGFSYKIPECDQYVRVGNVGTIITNMARELQFNLLVLDEMTLSSRHDILKNALYDILIIQG